MQVHISIGCHFSCNHQFALLDIQGQAGQQIELQSGNLSQLSEQSLATQQQINFACDNIVSILQLINEKEVQDDVDIRYIHQLVSDVVNEVNALKTLSGSNAQDCEKLQHQGQRLNQVALRIVQQLAAFKTR